MRLTNVCVLSFSLAAGSCSGDSSPQPDASTDNFDQSALLANLADNVLLPAYERFHSLAGELSTAAASYCESLGKVDEDDKHAAAEAAWKNAMLAWQTVELMQVGPSSQNDGHLHDLVYSWPVVSPCAVDQEVMARYNAPGTHDLSQSLANRRGLDAEEYALFSDDLSSVCPPQIRPEGWDALSETQRRAARCDFVSAAATDLVMRAQEILDGWKAEGGNFAAKLKMAGSQGSEYSSSHEAINQIFAGLFYIDTVTKDQKLAEPTGLLDNVCNTKDAPCPMELESQYAHHSKENIAANLAGFRMLFFGNGDDGSEGTGFDDYLIARGHGELVATLKTAVDNAQAAVDAIPKSAADALANDYASVLKAHSSVKELTDALKGEIPSILDLEIPTEAGGDND